MSHAPVRYIYASSSLLGCHVGMGPISAVIWYWVSILCSWTGFRVECSPDNARQLNCPERMARGEKKKKMEDQIEAKGGEMMCGQSSKTLLKTDQSDSFH